MKTLSAILSAIKAIPLIKEFYEKLKKELYLFRAKSSLDKVDQAKTKEEVKERVIEASKKFNKK